MPDPGVSLLLTDGHLFPADDAARETSADKLSLAGASIAPDSGGEGDTAMQRRRWYSDKDSEGDDGGKSSEGGRHLWQ